MTKAIYFIVKEDDYYKRIINLEELKETNKSFYDLYMNKKYGVYSKEMKNVMFLADQEYNTLYTVETKYTLEELNSIFALDFISYYHQTEILKVLAKIEKMWPETK